MLFWSEFPGIYLVGGRKPCGQGFAVGKSSDLWIYATAPGGVADGRFCPGDKN